MKENVQALEKPASTAVRERDEFLVFGAPQICQDEIDEVVDTMRSGWLGTGPKVARFESDFGVYKGSGHTVAVNSCTAALQLSLVSLGIGPGDEVITTPLTFCATVNAIIHAGAMPVLADIDPATMNIDPNDIRRKLSPKTKAVLPVHFAGRPCDMDALVSLAEEHGLKMVEDCAHAIETEYRGKKAGTFGDTGCFSFYATKNVTSGEGGMLLARDQDVADRAKVLALHGMTKDAWQRFRDAGYAHYFVVEAGFKFNMMDVQAAIGIHQLHRVEDNWLRRREIWNRYQDELRDTPLVLPSPEESHERHAYHLYTILVDTDKCGLTRDDFLNAMTSKKIGIGVHYMSIPEHPFYRTRYGLRLEDTPNATRVGRATVSLPLSARLTDDDVEDVVWSVRNVLGVD